MLIYDICFSLSDLFHSVWQSLSPFKSLLMTQFHSFYGWVIAHCRKRRWHPTPVLLPGKSHGWSSLVGCNPWGCKELDTTEQPHFHFSLSCLGEGNGNPLQCSCLENPRDRGAWWAAVFVVAQSRTRLKRLSRSRSSILQYKVKSLKGKNKGL